MSLYELKSFVLSAAFLAEQFVTFTTALFIAFVAVSEIRRRFVNARLE